MSAKSSVLLKILIISICNLIPFCSGNTISHGINSNHNHNTNNNGITDWQRNIEAQISRVVGRLDQLELRVGRVQSVLQMRFDNIENGLTMTKLRMDLWGDELTRIEEQLSRKWKTFESKFDIMVGSIDNKLDSKLTAMQRDNRRHNEYLSAAFNSVAVGQDKLHEKVHSSMTEVNTSLEDIKNTAKNSTTLREPLPSEAILVENSDKMLHILEEFISNTTSLQKIQSHSSAKSVSDSSYQNQSLVQCQLLGNKVTNMFEDLMTRSTSMETTLKDAIVVTNATRKDVHDGFRTILTAGYQNNNNNNRYNNNNHNNNGGSNGRSSNSIGGGSISSGSSSEVMSAVIVEALASVESMSSALGRRITEFSRSIDERLEIVSTSINGFLESCMRIQEGSPLIEEHIADLLMKILDTVDNSTRSASELWLSVAKQILDDRENMTRCPNGINPSSSITSTETIIIGEPESHHDHEQEEYPHQPVGPVPRSSNGSTTDPLLLSEPGNKAGLEAIVSGTSENGHHISHQHRQSSSSHNPHSHSPHQHHHHHHRSSSSHNFNNQHHHSQSHHSHNNHNMRLDERIDSSQEESTTIPTTTTTISSQILGQQGQGESKLQQILPQLPPSSLSRKKTLIASSSSTTTSATTDSSSSLIRPSTEGTLLSGRTIVSGIDGVRGAIGAVEDEDEILTEELTEEDKKSMWESYFRPST